MARILSLSIYLLTALFIATVFCSCSTIHHTIPPRPLDHNEYRSDFLISYDINSVNVVPCFGMNFFWGVGKEYNLGFGYNPPIGVSHLTIAKYLNVERDNSFCVFTSLNSPLLSLNEHPNFEFGGSAIFRSNIDYHSISTGIWLDIDGEYPLPTYAYPLRFLLRHEVGFRPKLAPFIKYQYSQINFRISVHNYVDVTRRNLRFGRMRTLGQSDKFIIDNSNIDSVGYDSSGYPSGYIIFMNRDSNYKLAEYLPYDFWIGDTDLFMLNRYPVDDSTRPYYLFKGNRPFPSRWYSLYEINIGELISDYENGKDIVIEYNPQNTERIINKIKWYLNDWSVGAGWKYK